MANTGTTAFPAAYDAYDNPIAGVTLENESGFSHSALHSQVHDAIEAIEVALGTHSAGTGVFAKRNNETFGTPTITGGTITGMDISGTKISGTPSLTNGTINTPLKLTPTVGTLVDTAGGTIAIDAATAQVFELTMGTTAGNRTIANPTNPSDGQSFTLRAYQNSAATGTILWGTNYRFSSEVGTPSMGTASTLNYFSWRYNTAGTKWDFVGQSKNII